MRVTSSSLLALLVGAAACGTSPGATEPVSQGPYTTFKGNLNVACPAVRPRTVLIDPTHDGGTWWFPQYALTPDGYHADQPHQGRALADYLRSKGYTVTELGRAATMSPDSMMAYAVIIRAGYYYDINHPGYTTPDLDAYSAFTGCQRTLIVLGEYFRDARRDDLADRLGFPLEGNVKGDVDSFESHPLTAGVATIPYIAGSWLAADASPDVQVLGRVGARAVMGLLTGRPAKVFFIGDVNGLQTMPQPFTDNLIAWGF